MNPWTMRIDYGRAELAVRLPQQPNEHRPERQLDSFRLPQVETRCGAHEAKRSM